MTKMSRCRLGIGPKRLPQVFQHISRAAKFPHQFVPAMQKFGCPRLTIRRVGGTRQWAFPIILGPNHIAIFGIAVRDLQAGWLFVLADVQATVA